MEHDVEIEFRPLGTTARHWDDKAKVLDLVPQFYRGERYALLASIVVNIKGMECGEFMLRMNGKTGDLSIVDRTKTVDPPIVLLAKKGAEESKGALPANTPTPK